MSQAIYASRTIPRFALSAALLSLAITLDSHQTGALTRDSSAAATTITVTRSDDPTPGSLTATCGFTSGTFVAAASGCSLRRAILEAAARPPTDRPIAIVFNLPISDTNKDRDAAGTWTIELAAGLPPLKTPSLLDTTGRVTVDGATQPGGRAAGPKIIIDMNDTSWDIASTENIVRNLSIQRGGPIFLKAAAFDNLIEDIWMGLSGDGQSIVLRDAGNPRRLAIGGGVHIMGSNNIVRNSKFVGAFSKAIEINSGTSGNLILTNTIGLRADGTVPALPSSIECLRSNAYDPGNWYGGWGISLAGSNQRVQGNVIAGLHWMQSPTEAPPIEIELLGSGHQIRNNWIGVDINRELAWSCGNGIKLAGSGSTIADNLIARTRVGNEASAGGVVDAAIYANDSSPLFGQHAIRRNVVIDGPGKVHDFGPAIPTALKTFNPARVTAINGAVVSGISGSGSPCPGCVIDLFADDGDTNAEALRYLGSTTATVDGAWSITMAAPLTPGLYLRTMSIAANSGVIAGYGAGTTTRTSKLWAPLTAVNVSGTLTASAGVTRTFEISAAPLAATVPISFVIEATDAQTINQAFTSPTINVSYRWTTPGVKTVRVVATNELGSVETSFAVTVDGGSTPSTPAPTTGPGGASRRTLLPVVSR
jgi:hypothetical protein